MNLKLFLFIFIPLSLLFFSCKRVPFDPDIETLNEKQLVVDGVIGNHPDYRTIELTRTAPYMDTTEVETVENAEVIVSGPDQSYNFDHTEKGLYMAPKDFKAGSDTTYHLKIDIENERYEAKSTMGLPVNMHSLKVKEDRWEEDSDADIYEIIGSVKDNPRKDERFIFKYAVNGELNDSVKVWSHYHDELTNDQWLNDTMIFGNIEAEEGDSINIYALSIGEIYYNFIQAAEKNRISHNPFSPPGGIPVKGNIDNGALGIFQVSAIVEDSVKVPEEDSD
ncbi:MAG: DUF4249 domain-containing protein [Bacteroidota bacterium]